jgi:cob(I)alamin adenosyltransferase
LRLYTRTGDDGTTSLFDGQRVPKDDPRVEACGALDELNAHLGAAAAAVRRAGVGPAWEALAGKIEQVQAELFTLGAEVATPAGSGREAQVPHCRAEHAARLESWIDEATAATGELRSFILPGGSDAACQLHVCRTVSRRAERRLVALAAANPQAIIYLNRLSDLLFAWARYANHLAGVADVPWVRPPG